MKNVEQQVATLQSEFAERAVVTGSLFLLKPMDAAAYIDAGYGLGLVLAGVEGFVVYPEQSVQPLQELSNDSADSELSEKEFLENTKQLILGVGERMNVAFEVVFESTFAHGAKTHQKEDEELISMVPTEFHPKIRRTGRRSIRMAYAGVFTSLVAVPVAAPLAVYAVDGIAVADGFFRGVLLLCLAPLTFFLGAYWGLSLGMLTSPCWYLGTELGVRWRDGRVSSRLWPSSHAEPAVIQTQEPYRSPPPARSGVEPEGMPEHSKWRARVHTVVLWMAGGTAGVEAGYLAECLLGQRALTWNLLILYCTGGAATSGLTALPYAVCSTLLPGARICWGLRVAAAICAGGMFYFGGRYAQPLQQVLGIADARYGLFLVCVCIAAALVIERLSIAGQKS